MDINQYRKAVDRDQELLSQGIAPEGTETCASCETPLQRAITGREMIGNDQAVCSDCYFEHLGNEIEKNPIGHAPNR